MAAGQPGIPQNLIVQTANQEILVSWDLVVGATAYLIQRSLDNVTFTALTTVTGSPLATEYLDTGLTLGQAYYYQVAASNGLGTSSYTTSQSATPAAAGEMTLGAIRLSAQQSADRINSQFVTKQEWNSFINLALYELYDLLITTFEDYYVATPIQFPADGSTYRFALPNGSNSFLNADTGVSFVPSPFYKLLGVDLALQNATNAYVTINKFNFIDRNRFVYPNTASTIYGVFNLQYRVLGNQIMFIPTPSAGQNIRLWYVPRLTELLADSDISDSSISGWMRYVIVRAAIYALSKEESDVSVLMQELGFLKQRIEESAAERDAGQPDTISDTNSNGGWGRSGGFNGPRGGWAALFIPSAANNYIGHASLSNTILFSQSSLAYVALSILISYLLYLNFSKLSGWISFARTSNGSASNHYIASLFNHISDIVARGTNKQMIRTYAARIVASVTDKHSLWNGTKMQYIRKTMSAPVDIVSSYLAIAAGTFSRSPLPAPVRLVNFTPKSFHVGSVSRRSRSVK